jgi:hypothetical protein
MVFISGKTFNLMPKNTKDYFVLKLRVKIYLSSGFFGMFREKWKKL